MTRIVFLDRGTIGPSVELTPPKAAHEMVIHARSTEAEVVERLAGARIAITNKVPLRRASLMQLPDLKFITVAATGYDVIDLEACRELGITVSNVRGYAVNTVPEHTLALMLALKRALPGYRQDVLAGEWQRAGQFCFFNHKVSDLAGARLGLIGRGSIGQAVARLARAFGMEVVFAAHGAGGADVVPMAELLATSDVISLHLPLSAQSRNIIAAPQFAQMARRPVLLNTARGGLVNEADAAAALEAGQISGLGFDVLTQEPPSADNPLMQIAHRPDVILTPHTAWASAEAMQGLWAQVVESIDAYLAGAPVRVL